MSFSALFHSIKNYGLTRLYFKGFLASSTLLFAGNIITGEHIQAHTGDRLYIAEMDQVVTISAIKSLSYSTGWFAFWPYVFGKWLVLPNKPCTIGVCNEFSNNSFVWKYNRNGIVPYLIPAHDEIVRCLRY